MSDVVYSIRISHLEYSGLKIMYSQIGESTDIDDTLRQYSRGNRDIELLGMWTPNPKRRFPPRSAASTRSRRSTPTTN